MFATRFFFKEVGLPTTKNADTHSFPCFIQTKTLKGLKH